MTVALLIKSGFSVNRKSYISFVNKPFLRCTLSKKSNKRILKLVPRFHLWLQYSGKPIIGKGSAAMLEKINLCRSISKAATDLNLSYSYVWKRLRKMEEALGSPLIKTERGGIGGGGKADLTPLGRRILLKYCRVDSKFNKLASGESSRTILLK
jgi:molybdate transport system regulatory protein